MRGFPALKETFGNAIANRVAEWLEYREFTSGYTGPTGSGSNSNNQLPPLRQSCRRTVPEE